MNNPRLNQARAWARDNIDDFYEDESAYAVCEVIQSLPDQWIDADKVREEADRMDRGAENSMKPGHNEFSRGYAEAMQECAEHLRNLLAPPLPTLADLIEQGGNSEDYHFCWAETEDGLQIIVIAGDFSDESVYTMDERGYRFAKDWSEIRPRTDLPRLEWPGSHADTITEEPEGFQNQKS